MSGCTVRRSAAASQNRTLASLVDSPGRRGKSNNPFTFLSRLSLAGPTCLINNCQQQAVHDDTGSACMISRDSLNI